MSLHRVQHPSVPIQFFAFVPGRYHPEATHAAHATQQGRTVRALVLRTQTRTLFVTAIFLTILALCGHAQTIDDGIMVPKNALFGGTLYTHDAWDHYWEGALNRTNGNLGTVTTQAVTYSANYGLMKRLNVMGLVPFVWTNASQGVLHPQRGFQDLTLGAKYQLLVIQTGGRGAIEILPALSGSIPMTNYSPDFQPLSIGFAATTIAPRLTANFQGFGGLYLNGSTAYVFRGIVTLDRPYYFTNDQITLSNQVAMPNQFNYTVSAGYRGHGMMFLGSFAKQQTRGGGDIRRQDAPFVSNRMNFSKGGTSAVVPIPFVKNLQGWFMYTNTFDGRNVGQSNTFTTGVMYMVHFSRKGITQ